MVKDMQVVVTGASGFVAKNVRKYLSDNNVKLSFDKPSFLDLDFSELNPFKEKVIIIEKK